MLADHLTHLLGFHTQERFSFYIDDASVRHIIKYFTYKCIPTVMSSQHMTRFSSHHHSNVWDTTVQSIYKPRQKNHIVTVLQDKIYLNFLTFPSPQLAMLSTPKLRTPCALEVICHTDFGSSEQNLTYMQEICGVMGKSNCHFYD